MAQTTPREKKSNADYDLNSPDSLITQDEAKTRRQRLDKFQRRAARPVAKSTRRHSERIKLIDYLLSVNTDPMAIDCMIACLKMAGSLSNQYQLEHALTILNDKERALDNSGGPMYLPISTELRCALIDGAKGSSDQWTLAASILYGHFGIAQKQKAPSHVPPPCIPSDCEVERALSEIERLSEYED
jgi:hypothetical protein